METEKEINVFKKNGSLEEYAFNLIKKISDYAIKEKGVFTLALSGGKSPVDLYDKLAKHKRDIDWDNFHIFLVDERFVSKYDKDSNYRLLKERLFNKIGIDEQNIHEIRTDLKLPEMSAELYEKEIKKYFGLRDGEFPVFDLIMLGFGEDGHTASLFPSFHFDKTNDHLAVAVVLDDIQHNRISITLPVINNARNIALITKGKEKAHIIKEVISTKNKKYPASYVVPEHGKIFYLLDEDAGAELYT